MKYEKDLVSIRAERLKLSLRFLGVTGTMFLGGAVYRLSVQDELAADWLSVVYTVLAVACFAVMFWLLRRRISEPGEH